MERPNFQPIFSSKNDFCEVTDEKPVETFIPNQAMKLSELMQRFERGQRLGVHCNFAPESEMTNGSIYEESFDDAPPICHDLVDVHEYYEAHQVHKREFTAKQKKKKEEVQQAKAQPADDSANNKTEP